VEKVFLDDLKGFLAFIIPCTGIILPQKFEDRFTSGSEFGNESINTL